MCPNRTPHRARRPARIPRGARFLPRHLSIFHLSRATLKAELKELRATVTAQSDMIKAIQASTQASDTYCFYMPARWVMPCLQWAAGEKCATSPSGARRALDRAVRDVRHAAHRPRAPRRRRLGRPRHAVDQRRRRGRRRRAAGRANQYCPPHGFAARRWRAALRRGAGAPSRRPPEERQGRRPAVAAPGAPSADRACARVLRRTPGIAREAARACVRWSAGGRACVRARACRGVSA